MKLNVSIANNQAIKLYLVGLSMRHRLFAPISERAAMTVRKHIKMGDFSLPDYKYSKFKHLKSRVLSLYIPKELSKKISLVKLVNINMARSKALKLKLIKSFDVYKKGIESFLKKNRFKTRGLFSVVIMPHMGESAESLGDLLVIGDAFSKDVAIPVILEEILHSIVTTSKAKKVVPFNTRGVSRDEVAVGFYLHGLLNALRYDKVISDSVVFGWQAGRRSVYVKKAIAYHNR